MILFSNAYSLRPFEGTYTFPTDATGPSDYILMPNNVDRITAQIQVPSTAIAVVQATASTTEEITSGAALWQDWSVGPITGGVVAQDATTGPLGAIRINVLTALAANNVTLSIRAQGVRV